MPVYTYTLFSLTTSRCANTAVLTPPGSIHQEERPHSSKFLSPRAWQDVGCRCEVCRDCWDCFIDCFIGEKCEAALRDRECTPCRRLRRKKTWRINHPSGKLMRISVNWIYISIMQQHVRECGESVHRES